MDTTMPAKAFYRVTFRQATAIGKSATKRRSVWATNLRRTTDDNGERVAFVVCDNEGLTVQDDTLNIVICRREDIIRLEPARMNRHYAELEVVK